MKRKPTLLVIACVCSYITFSQTLIEDFTDGNYTSNQTWSGSTSEFSVITDGTLPNGSASTDEVYLASKASQGDVSLAFASTEVSEWRFSIGSPNFNPSGTNYLGVVLMASATFSGDLINDNITNDFQGYYLRIGDHESDAIELWRKTGSGEAIVGEFPNSPSFSIGALQNGLNIRVTRNSSGVFELFYSIGFQNNSIPTTSAGTLTNTAYNTSNYFGVFQNIGSKSADRRIYIDNIELGVVTWDGSNSNDWTTDANWDTNSTPSSTDNIIITSSLTNYPTVTTAETINSLIINSGATLVATNAGFTTTNDAIYTRNLANGSQWYLMSSPVSSENYDDTWVSNNSIPFSTQDTGNRGVSWYNNSSSDTDSDGGLTDDSATGYWRYMEGGSSTVFAVGRGYGIIRSTTGNVFFKGNGIYTTNQTFTLAQGENNFNLIGNPFPAFITLGTFHTTNTSNIGTDFYFWNGSSYTTRTSGVDSTYEIAPGQGFFIEASSTNNITFEISDTSHQSLDTFQKSKNERSEIILNVSDGNNKRFARILYFDNTTKGYDTGYDGKIFGGISHNFALYSDLLESNGKRYQVQSLPNSDYENMIIPIGLQANSGKDITFSAEISNLPTGVNVYLEDKFTNTFTRLDETNSSYKITLTEAVNDIGRFYLHTKSNILNVNDIDLNNVSVYKTDNSNLRITGLNQGVATVKLFNILGKQVMNSSFTSNGVKDIILPKMTSGIYVVQLESVSGKLNKKIFIQ